MTAPPVALTIAGSDSSAGAGVQADLKTFTALGVYGLTALTCVVAEVPGQVGAIQAIEVKIVAEQIARSFETFPVAAVKTGLLLARDIIEAICAELEKHPVPLVVDPVMIATSGAALLQAGALEVYRTRLFKLATVVTPNLDEVRSLLGRAVASPAEMRAAGGALGEQFGGAWLLKGGHLPGAHATDLLFAEGEIMEFSAPFVPGVSLHGTGCTLSAALAAGLARGLALPDAVAAAKRFVTRAIEQQHRWGGVAALNHFAF